MRRVLIALAGAVMVFFTLTSAASAQRITFDGGTGIYGGGTPDSVMTGSDIVLKLRFENLTSFNLSISNGFEIYSPNGATWSGPVRGDTLTGAIPISNWDVGFVMNTFLGTAGRDTVGIIGMKNIAAGLPASFNGIPYAIRIGQFDEFDIDLVVCLDSAWFRPGGTWHWTSVQSGSLFPAWGGPYCLVIVREPNCKRTAKEIAKLGCTPCCIDRTGNVDGDLQDMVDISDLSVLVTHLFAGGAISECPEENNVDASWDGSVDIADLSRLVDFLFYSQGLPFCPVI